MADDSGVDPGTEEGEIGGSASKTPTVTIKDNKPPKYRMKPEECIQDSPSGEELPPDEIEKIIESMLSILQDCQKKVDDQKIDSHSLAFMLLRIKESLDAYMDDYYQKLNSFLVQAERITADYYNHMTNSLPQFGDYIPAIEREKSDQIDAGEHAPPVKKQELLNLLKTVTDNYYATGMFIKSGRMLFKDVNNSQPERLDIVCKINTPLPKWMEFQDKVTNQLEQIREQTFKISAYVDFLRQGEMKMAPTLDLSQLTGKEMKLKPCPPAPDHRRAKGGQNEGEVID